MSEFTHLDKLYWKKEKITKGDLLRYYASVAPFLLPHLKDRPLVLHRFPEGIQGVHFYQKESGPHPSFIKTVSIQHEQRKIAYYVVQNEKSLLFVANLGSIELHPFLSRIKNLNRPDFLVLDLDPHKVSFDRVIDVANAFHALLDELKIPHYCKTSGGRGLHIYIPLSGKYSYREVKKYALILAKLGHQLLPKITSLERLPKNREGKVYIDYLQNSPMKSVVSPYSVRGRPGAFVSTPLLWKEVKYGLDPSQFTLQSIPKRLAKWGDLFKDVLKKKSNLSLLNS